MVKFPVFCAHGSVDDTELKYPPNGQPRIQRSLAWHCALPCCRCISLGCVNCAHLPWIINRSLYFDFIFCCTSFSTQLNSNGGRYSPSGIASNPSGCHKYRQIFPHVNTTAQYHHMLIGHSIP